MDVEKKVAETIKKYKLLSKKDKVVVALSGGKDSTSVLYILDKMGYRVEGLFIDLHLGDWSKRNLENVRKFCSSLNVELHVFDMKKELGSGICFIKDVVKTKKSITGCSVCGILKRWILNKTSRELGGTKLVTGHNLDDEAQTVLMNFLKGNVELGLNSGPKTGATFASSVPPAHPSRGLSSNDKQQRKDSYKDGKELLNRAEHDKAPLGVLMIGDSSRQVEQGSSKGFVQRVKPMFFIPESEIRKYSKKMKFPVLYERCPCAFGTYRVETRAWLDKISDKEKLNIVGGWLGVVGGLRDRFTFKGLQFSLDNNKIPTPNSLSKSCWNLSKVNCSPTPSNLVQRKLLRGSGATDGPMICKTCGEPARGDVCNACGIFGCLKEL